MTRGRNGGPALRPLKAIHHSTSCDCRHARCVSVECSQSLPGTHPRKRTARRRGSRPSQNQLAPYRRGYDRARGRYETVAQAAVEQHKICRIPRTSTACSTDRLVSAACMAGASFTPSPRKPTTCPFFFTARMIRSFWLGSTSTNRSVRSATVEFGFRSPQHQAGFEARSRADRNRAPVDARRGAAITVMYVVAAELTKHWFYGSMSKRTIWRPAVAV